MKNAEEKRNLPRPKLKQKPLKHECHGLKVHSPSSLKPRAAWLLDNLMWYGHDTLSLPFPKIMTSFEQSV